MKFQRVHLGIFITQSPGKTLAIVMILTLFFFLINMNPAIIGKEQYTEESEDAWFPDNDLSTTFDDLTNNYGSNAAFLQILVKGKNGNVLTQDALVDILEIERNISANEDVQYALYPPAPSPAPAGNILSLPSMLAYNLVLADGIPPSQIDYDAMILKMESLDQATIDMMFTANAENMSFLLTTDFLKNINSGQVKAEATLILVLFNSQIYKEITDEDNPILDADLEIVDIIDDAEFDGVKYMGINEQVYIEHVINTDTGMGTLFLALIIIIVVILLLTYRSVLDTLLSLGAIFFAIIWMNAFGIMLGLTFASIYDAVPIILIGLGIDYAIHITLRYDEGRSKERKSVRGAMLIAVATVGTSLLLSALTTGLSFSSNMVSALQPMREFGIFLMLGIMSAFILVVTMIPSAKVLADTYKLKRENKKLAEYAKKLRAGEDPGPPPPQPKEIKHKMAHMEAPLSRIALAASHKPIPIITVTIVLGLVCGLMAMQLETEFDFKDWLPLDHQITDDIVYTFDNFDFGVDETYVLIRGDVTDPAVLVAMDETQTNLLDDKHINEEAPIVSILTVMESAAAGTGPFSQQFSIDYAAADTDGDGIPDQNIEALYLDLMDDPVYESMALNVIYYNEDTNAFEGALIRVSVNTQGGDYNQEIDSEMNADIEPLEDVDNIEVFATGEPIFMNFILTSISTSGLQSTLITVVMAGIILCTLFVYEYRSFALGIFTVIPVILVILWIYGTMYMVGVPLTIMTIMISSITVGIGIDYAIHVTNRFMESIHDSRDVDLALKNTVVNTGGALFGAAITTIGGFGILYLAPTNPMRLFGTLTAMAIAYSFISSIVCLPAFLGVYARWKLAKDPDYFEKHVDIDEVREHVVKHIQEFDKKLKGLGKELLDAEYRFANGIIKSQKELAGHAKKAGDRIKRSMDEGAVKMGEAGRKMDEGAREAGRKVGEGAKKAGEKMKPKK